MTALYVTSLSENAGKTMLCVGLGKSWQGSGKKVGYFKPRISNTGSQSENDKDAAFAKQVLALQEPVEVLSPVISTQGDITGAVKRVYAQIAQGKDIILVDGQSLNASGPMVDALDARVLVIHDYSAPLSASLPEYKKLSMRLSGVVLNKVPRRKIAEIQTSATSELSDQDVNFLGAIPEDRVLMGLTVAELAELLQGKILNNSEKSNELVENIMLGAMTFDSGPEYFGRKNDKAVILKGERPDMQMAALQTSTRCIVLSGGSAPLPVVAQQATSKKIPLISAPGDVQFLITIIEKSINQIKFSQERKLPQLMAILSQNLDLKPVYQELGL
jgi:BioD-like phosphotransacetylase family protein